MGIKDFMDKTVVVSRLKTVAGNRRRFNTTATVDIHIQEQDIQERRELDNVQDRTWIGYFSIDDSDSIQKGDKITVGGIDYKVVEKTPKDYAFANNQHVEILFVEYSKS